MKRVIIVHRWEGGSHDDWRPWLKSELEKLGYEVQVPDMPDTDTPVIEKWVNKLSEVVGIPDANTYFVGHSIGCQTILRYLETINTPVGGAVFVAGWFYLDNLENDEVKEIAKPWIETPINLEKVKLVLPTAILIISENDPYGCLEENKQKFAEVMTKGIVVPFAGHFTAGDGYAEIPTVVDELKGFLVPDALRLRLKEEGFAHVFDWHDEPNTKYEPHAHKGRVSFYVIRGLVTFSGGITETVKAGERFDVPVGVNHSAAVGPDGCDWIVGEEIEGDS